MATSVALVLTAVALAGACGGSSAKSPAAGNTTTSGAGAAGTNFSALLGKLPKAAFKVTYTDAAGNEQVYAQDGNGNTVTINGDSQVYTTRTTAVTCEQATGATTFTCTQSPIRLGANSGYIALAVAEKTYATALRFRFGHTSTKSIAARDADCFTMTAGDFEGVGGIAGAAGASLKGEATYCNDRETGAVVENTITGEDGDLTNLLVTKFEAPTAKDFQPPATPTIVTIPGGPVTTPGGVGAQ